MRKQWVVGSIMVVALACGRDEAPQPADGPQATATRQNQSSGEGPIGARISREEIERQRFNVEWQRLRSFQLARRAAAADRQKLTERVQLTFVVDPKFAEKLDSASLQTIDTAPVRVPIQGDVGGPSVLRAQVLLDRLGFSPGVLDGRWGKNTAIAVYWFQRQNDLETSGAVDEPTFRALANQADYPPAVTEYTISADDADGPFTPIPDDVYDQEKLECLCYESLNELLSEKFHTTPDLLSLLNPGVDLNQAQAGQRLRVLNIRPPLGEGAMQDVQKLIVSVEGNYLHAVDSGERILMHAPTTVGNKYDPSPSETLTIVGISHDPEFHYQPKLFHEVADTDPEAHLKPGPNSPVGVVWMALSKPHYGIHGTGDPDSIGYASSHGCIRLTNWDANDLARRVRAETPVDFVDERAGGGD